MGSEYDGVKHRAISNMLSSEGKPTDTSTVAKHKPSKTIETGGASSFNSNQQLEREQIFQLIDSILCFEACLYHQVLPLKLENNSLLLGIVNPKDAAALDYVNCILSHLNCTVVNQPVAAETHRIILSEYLNYKNTLELSKLPSQEASLDSNHEKEVVNQSLELSKLPSQEASLDSNHEKEVVNQSLMEDLEEESEPGDNTLILFDSTSRVKLESLSQTKEQKKSPVTTALRSENFEKNTEADVFQILSAENLPVLRLPLPESFSADVELSTLPPKKLLKELLARVLAGGIGRLYLERQPYQGRILWSLSGIVQSVIEQLPLSAFQGVLNELKRMSSLPIATLAHSKQVETECLYQEQRLLLRLRVMPGMYGEEATLQVLRGAALKFHQQQQLTRLTRDALGASQQLSYKVHELQQKLALNIRELNPQQLESLKTLKELVENLDSHLRILTDIPTV